MQITQGNVAVVFQARDIAYEGQIYAYEAAIVLEYSNETLQFGKVENVLFLFDTP